MTQRLDENGDVETHVNRMNELFQKLLAFGDTLKPEFILSATILGSLPESYDGLVQALEARIEELTANLVCSKVIAEYKRRSDRKHGGFEDSTAMRVSVNRKIVCYFCKEDGHMKRNCEKYKTWLQKKENDYQMANLV